MKTQIPEGQKMLARIPQYSAKTPTNKESISHPLTDRRTLTTPPQRIKLNDPR